eukprot:c6528_g1_i1.p2 GENE.c6528_g1_i1~~c6528_g1_i1.p2  ORF type:complete len:217 (+),score=53.66 c6528_g1_i1:40-651(+)
MASEFDYLLKCLMIGDCGVGKSSILKRYVDDTLPGEHQSTIGVDFKIKSVVKDGKSVKLQIWDTAGQERFRTITRSYYRGAHVIVIVFDITSRDSFASLDMWLTEIDKNVQSGVICKLVVGNKCDRVAEREVATDEAEAYCKSRSLQYFEASAMQNTNITELFDSTLASFLAAQSKVAPGAKPKTSIEVVEKPKEAAPKGGCC